MSIYRTGEKMMSKPLQPSRDEYDGYKAVIRFREKMKDHNEFLDKQFRGEVFASWAQKISTRRGASSEV